MTQVCSGLTHLCKYIFMLADFSMEVQSIKEYVENICQ